MLTVYQMVSIEIITYMYVFTGMVGVWVLSSLLAGIQAMGDQKRSCATTCTQCRCMCTCTCETGVHVSIPGMCLPLTCTFQHIQDEEGLASALWV